MEPKRLILIIMDGWGIAEDPSVSAVDAARTPFYDRIRREYPNTFLQASHEYVGLPHGQMGNSEVGHMNLGAGRVLYQELLRVSRSIESGEFAGKEAWKAILDYCRTNQKPLHLLGLVSDGGVHAHISHLKGILSELSREDGFPPIYIHAFTDGRDCDPKSGERHLRDLEAHCKATGTGILATVCGRFYAMDRNKNWDRTALAYNMLVKGEGERFASAQEAISASYAAGVSDEFITPKIIADARIQTGDAVLFFNFRTDRGRQLTTALTQKEFPEHGMKPLPLHFTTLTRYDETYTGVHVVYEMEIPANGLGETLSKNGKTQIRIAETEKYPHVTFFFNGQLEEPMPGERRIIIPSPSVKTYDLQPEMSAFAIRDAILPEIRAKSADFICLNFANPDMVGHTGVFEAAVKACETVDFCTEAVSLAALKHGYTVFILADHGNADRMKNPDGTPHTAHTTVPVPFIVLTPKKHNLKLSSGKLGDIAPTILYMMGLPVPAEMTGKVLVEPFEVFV